MTAIAAGSLWIINVLKAICLQAFTNTKAFSFHRSRYIFSPVQSKARQWYLRVCSVPLRRWSCCRQSAAVHSGNAGENGWLRKPSWSRSGEGGRSPVGRNEREGGKRDKSGGKLTTVVKPHYSAGKRNYANALHLQWKAAILLKPWLGYFYKCLFPIVVRSPPPTKRHLRSGRMIYKS